MISNKKFAETLSGIITDELKMNLLQFSEFCRIPYSTLYKIVKGEREPNLGTLRAIIQGLKKAEKLPEKDFIAVIAAKHVLEDIEERIVRTGGKEILVREYPATSIEEAIVSAVMAEKDGAMALVCAPIISNIVEKIVEIPVSIIRPRRSVEKAIENAVKKLI